MTQFTLPVFGIIILSIFATANFVYAETDVKSTNVEKTTLIEITNNDSAEIKTIKLWLGKDSGSFKSFKIEKGWTGTKSPQGVLVFSSETPLVKGESLKIGVKTETENPGINWKMISPSGSDLSIGKTSPQVDNNPINSATLQKDKQVETTNIENASFRIIPESPKNGDTVRIIGEGFQKNANFDFLIDGKKLEDFQADENGHLIGKATIPLNKEADRVEFSLVDSNGKAKTISIRIAHSDTPMTQQDIKRLTVDKFDSLIEPGRKASISGTGKAGSSVTITAKDLTGVKIYEAVVPVDNQGNWSHETTIPLNAELGSRQIDISDGIDTITKTVSVSLSKTIRVTSSAIKYNPGDKMIFNGTARPNQVAELVIDDPIGKEIFSDILEINDSGVVSFEYQTTSTSTKGTYVVFVTQGDETEIIRIGLGDLPSEAIFAKFDKLNYATSEKAKLTVEGPAEATISLLIIDPSDKVKLSDSVTTGLDGSKEYEIDLSTYKSGIYSVVLKYTKSQTKVVFAVGLQSGSGKITMHATKEAYQPGESILILGSTEKPNVLLNLELIDPDTKVVKSKELFTDKEGKFSDSTFRIPSDAKQGQWDIKAKSGSNLAESKFSIAGTITKTFSINVDKSTPYRIGDILTISGTGGGKTQTVVIKIFDAKNVMVEELTMSSTKDGSFQTIWVIPPGQEPGQYKIETKIGSDAAETKFTIQ